MRGSSKDYSLSAKLHHRAVIPKHVDFVPEPPEEGPCLLYGVFDPHDKLSSASIGIESDPVIYNEILGSTKTPLAETSESVTSCVARAPPKPKKIVRYSRRHNVKTFHSESSFAAVIGRKFSSISSMISNILKSICAATVKKCALFMTYVKLLGNVLLFACYVVFWFLRDVLHVLREWVPFCLLYLGVVPCLILYNILYDIRYVAAPAFILAICWRLVKKGKQAYNRRKQEYGRQQQEVRQWHTWMQSNRRQFEIYCAPLGIDPTATWNDASTNSEEYVKAAKKAHRKKVIKFHPDKCVNKSKPEQDRATEEFRKVQEAYEWLMNIPRRPPEPSPKEAFGSGIWYMIWRWQMSSGSRSY